MDDLNSGEHAAEHDGDEAAVSQAVLTLSEIARQLRELADYSIRLSNEPLFEPTLH